MVLKILPSSGDDFLSKLIELIIKPKPTIEIKQHGDVGYGVICVKMWRNDISWQGIEDIALEHSRWILLPPSLTLPRSSRLREYNSQTFDRQVFLKTACNLIADTKIPMYRRVLGFLDEDGKYSDMLYPLLKYYTSVKVITSNPQCYSQCADAMMEELGAPVMVCENLSSLSDCSLIISPGVFACEDDFKIPCPILTHHQSDINLRYRCDIISGLSVLLPNKFLPIPPDIDEHLFASALAQLCDVKEISFTAGKLIYNGVVLPFDDIVKLVRKSCGYY